ncbi:MAG: dephospho-CoA kinase [Clostridia bacterium]|nr:dephospho-CoA kinase [Clostridia bacterium]
MSLILGVTGGSGCGKSNFCRNLAEKGAYVIDADIVARDVVRPKERALLEIEKEFGKEYILPNGELDRKKLGALVFSDSDKLNILNQITHKYIIKEIKKRLGKSSCGLKIIDAAVLFESGLADICDRTVCVLADKDIRAKRISERDNLTCDAALNRINAQQSDDFYRSHSDDVILNNGTEEELAEEAKKYFKKLENLF